MPNQSQDQVTSLVNVPAVEQEFDAVEKMIERTRALIVSMPKIMGDYSKSSGGTEQRTATEELAKSNAKLSESYQKLSENQSKIKTVADQLYAAKIKLAEGSSAEAKELAQVNLQLQENAKNLKTEAALSNAVNGSIEEAILKRKQLAQQLVQMGLNSSSSKEKAAELREEMDKLTGFIKANSAEAEKQRMNIGNYAGSFKQAFSTLGAELTKIKNQIAATGKESPGFDELNKKASVLEKIMEALSVSTGSTRQELKILQESAKQLGTEFGISSKEFQNFVQVVGERKDELEDIQKVINFQSSDTKYIDGVVNSIQAVVGAYGAYQSVAVLVGGENKELEKQMVKLQAILTLVTSVQAVANALQSESGAIQTILAGKTALVAAAESLLAIAKGKATVATVVETAATEAQAVANVEGAAAMEAGAVAAETLEVGMVGAAAAEGAAAAGAVSLSAAIVATGIGALIIGVVYGITKLVQASISWVSINDDVIKSNADVAKSINDVATAQKEYDGIRAASSAKVIEQLERENDLKKAAGVTTVTALALDKGVATEKARISTEEYQRNKDKIKDLDLYSVASLRAAKQVVDAESKIQFYKQQSAKEGKKVNEDVLQHYQNEADVAKANATVQKNTYENLIAIRDNYIKDNEAVTAIDVKVSKQSDDDRRKYSVESAKIEADAVTARNQLILDDESNTLAKRLQAMKEMAKARRDVMLADKNAITNDPTASDTDKRLAEEKYASDLKKDRGQERAREEKEKESFRQIDLAANLSIEKTKLQTSIDSNKAIADNQDVNLAERIAALKAASELQKKLIEDDATAKLDKKGMTKDERTDIETKRDADLLKLAKDTAIKMIDITASQQKAEEELRKTDFENIAKFYEEANQARAQKYTEDTINLNEQYNKGFLSYKNLIEGKRQLDFKYARDILQSTKNQIAEQLALYKDVPEKKKLAEADLVAAQAEFNVASTEQDKEVAAKRVTTAKKSLDDITKVEQAAADLRKRLTEAGRLLSEADTKKKKDDLTKWFHDVSDVLGKIQGVYSVFYNAIAGMNRIHSEKIINDLQDQIDANNALKDTEVKNISESTLGNEEKANRIQIAERTTAAKNEELAQKQRDQKQKDAQFNKDLALFNIVIKTAQAVVAALAEGNFFGAIVAGAAGAVEYAIASAEPVPHYYTGTKSSQEGWAMTDELGPELYISPRGEITEGGSKPALRYLERGTEIIRHDQVNNYKLAMASQSVSTRTDLMDGKFDELKSAILSVGREQIKVIKKQRTNVNVKVDNNFWIRIQNSI